MPGTGISGYTGGSLYGGGYNIQNGIIQGGSNNSAVRNANNVSNSIANLASQVGSEVARYISNSKSKAKNIMASDVAGALGTGQSDYADYMRQLMEISANNTAQSQAFAREQMEYQRQSDATAMAWSANEANKNREWQERLSNTAHQREVQDLIAAGLNPILSANNGAFTGSGATGQGFSSSGAMGNVDTTAGSAIGSLMSTIMNTASQASIAKMYTDATKYQADLAYSASKMNTEASIMNNRYSNDNSKEIAYAGYANELRKVNLQGNYGLQNTALQNEGMFNTENLRQFGENTRTGMTLEEKKWKDKADVALAIDSFLYKISTDPIGRAMFGIQERGNQVKQGIGNFSETKIGKWTHDIWQKIDSLPAKLRHQGLMEAGDLEYLLDEYYKGNMY